MKRILILLAFTTVALPGAKAQGGEGNGTIVLSGEGGSEVTINRQESDPRGFTIAVAGYEIGFSGNRNGVDLIENNKKSRSRKTYKGKLAIVDFGFNALTSASYKNYGPSDEGFLDLRIGKSNYVAFNPFRVSSAITRDGTLGFTAGIGLVWRNYSFDNPLTIVKERGRIEKRDLDPEGLTKTKLTTFALNIPVTLDVNFGNFFVSGGVYGGIVTGAHTKYKKPKTKATGGFYTDMFDYGITARAGYRHFYLFGNYGLNDLFKSDKGPEARTYSLGFSFPF